MKNRVLIIKWILLILPLTAFVLSSCGQQVCVMGIGNCETPVKKDVTTQASGTLKLTVSAATLLVGQKVTFTATGGVPPYKFDIYQGEGTLQPSGAYTTDTTSSYTAPSTVAADGLNVKVSVTDSGVPTKNTDFLGVFVKLK